jgi:hypothetical protein
MPQIKTALWTTKTRATTKFDDFNVHLPIPLYNVYLTSNNLQNLPTMKLNQIQYTLIFKFL